MLAEATVILWSRDSRVDHFEQFVEGDHQTRQDILSIEHIRLTQQPRRAIGVIHGYGIRLGMNHPHQRCAGVQIVLDALLQSLGTLG